MPACSGFRPDGVYSRACDGTQAELAERLGRTTSSATACADLGLSFHYLLTTPTADRAVDRFPSANFVAWGVLTWMPTYLHEKFGMSVTKAGIIGTFYIQIASMCGAVAGGFLADFWRRFALGGRMATQALGLLARRSGCLLLRRRRYLRTAIAAMIIFGFCKGVYDSNIWAAIYDVIPAARRGTIVGLANFVGWMAGPAARSWSAGAVDNRAFDARARDCHDGHGVRRDRRDALLWLLCS